MFELMMFAFLNLLGVMSPGPDFVAVTRFGLTGSRRAAFGVTLGITAALLIHVFYCVSGVAIFLHSSPRILQVIQLLGATYLGYLGIKLLFQKDLTADTQEAQLPKQAFVTGFLTNLLNPKAMVFMLSLFSQFATAMNTMQMKVAFAVTIPLMAMLWFSSLSYFLTHPYFLPFLQKSQRKFMVAMGVGLLLLSFSGFLSVISK